MRQMLSRILVSVGLLVGFSPASFATLQFTIDVPNAALTPYTGPYAKVLVTRIDATHASIEFDSLVNGGNLYLMGDGGSVDLSVNAATYSISSGPAWTNPPGFGPSTFSANNPGNISSFGIMNLSLDFMGGFTQGMNKVTFTLMNTSGTWATDNDILVANNKNFFAAAHIFVCAVPCDPANGAVNTGFAGNNSGGGPPVTIPEPQTLALLGLGLVVLATMRRRRSS